MPQDAYVRESSSHPGAMLLPEEGSFRSVRKNVHATVRVYDPSGARPAVEATSSVSIGLEPGSYVVSIDAPDAVPAHFQLVVEKKPPEPSVK